MPLRLPYGRTSTQFLPLRVPNNEEAGHCMIPGLFNLRIARGVISAFAYSEHLRATLRADALSSRSAVLHGDGLGVAHLSLGTTLHAIRFHSSPPFLVCSHRGGLAQSPAVFAVEPELDQAFNHRD